MARARIVLECAAGAASSSPRARADIEHDLERVKDDEVTLARALTHPEFPEVVAALVGRGVRARVELGDERLTRGVARRLRELGVVGVDVAIEGLERLHDRCHGLGSFRARLGSLRAAEREGLGARAHVVLDPAMLDDLPELLALLMPICTQLRLVPSGPLSFAHRERAIAAAAPWDAVDLGDVALHGPSPNSGTAVPITEALVRALMRGGRWPAAEVGTQARRAPELRAAMERAGGLVPLGLFLAAMGAPVEDLPPCVGGRGRADAPTTHVAACLTCPARARCSGVPTELLDLARADLHPRRAWRGLPEGARVRVLPGSDAATNEGLIPPLAERLRAHGVEVVVGEGSLAGADLVIAWRYDRALDAIDDATLAPSARVVVGDFRMLTGHEALRARSDTGWPDERLEVVSAYPSFAHLYVGAGVPLERVTFRPWPLGTLARSAPGRTAFATCEQDGDSELLFATVDRLGTEGPTFDVLGHPSVGEGRPTLRFAPVPTFAALVELVRRARFVLLPLRWQRNVSGGGMPLALARALGRPIVATRVPMALDHLRDGVDALLVDPGDPAALADAVRRMHTDEALRTRLAEGAARSARASSAAAWADELKQGAPIRVHVGPRAWP